MSNSTLLVLGARSDIGKAIARTFAAKGYDVQLAARNAEGLADEASNLQLRFGVKSETREFDVLDLEKHADFTRSTQLLPDVVVCCVGYMGEQAQSETSATAAALVMRSNFEGPAAILEAFAAPFGERGFGTLVGISSVAGERGRASNYVYGAAKSGFTAYLSGLRNRLTDRGVHVITVLPGFVRTRMTEGMKLPKALTAEPDEVAKAVYVAVSKKRDVVHVRKIWRFIMLGIKNIPEGVFKKMNI